MRTSRRELLGLLLVTGCSAAPTPPAPPPPPVDPDLALRAAAAVREQVLLRAYDAALLAAPSLTSRLTPLRAEHAEHLAALAERSRASAAPAVSPTAPPAPAPSPAVPVPDSRTVLAGLVRAERTAATGHAADVAAASRALAGLLAALSASEASHPVALA